MIPWSSRLAAGIGFRTVISAKEGRSLEDQVRVEPAERGIDFAGTLLKVDLHLLGMALEPIEDRLLERVAQMR